MLNAKLSAVKCAHQRRQNAIAEYRAGCCEDRDEEMDLWPDDAPQVAMAYARLQAAIEACAVGPKDTGRRNVA